MTLHLVKSRHRHWTLLPATYKLKHQNRLLTLLHLWNQSLQHPVLATSDVGSQRHEFTRTTYCSNWAINLRWRSSWWTKLHKQETPETNVCTSCGGDVWDSCYASTAPTSLRSRSMCLSAKLTSFFLIKDYTILHLTHNTVLLTRLSVAQSVKQLTTQILLSPHADVTRLRPKSVIRHMKNDLNSHVNI